MINLKNNSLNIIGYVKTAFLALSVIVGLGLLTHGCGGRTGAPSAVSMSSAQRFARTLESFRVEKHAPLALRRGEISLFAAVFDFVERDYVQSVDAQTLLNEAMLAVSDDYDDLTNVTNLMLVETAARGMMSSLDPYSSYLDKEAFVALNQETQGNFGGLGIEVSMEDGRLKIVTPLDDTPALRAGLEAGDIITHADGVEIVDMSLREAVKLLRGDVGTAVRLGLMREGKAAFEREVTREIIHIHAVRSHLEGDVGYIRLTSFVSNVSVEITQAIEALQKEAGAGKLAGIVLDLRNNPGGLLSEAVSVSDVFLPAGDVVSTRGRQDNHIYRSTDGDIGEDIPLIVMINGGSASASEIVAGAVRDRNRGVLLGAKSYGKGSVQTIFPLTSRRGVKLTTARYFTPSGTTVDGGIEPHELLDNDPEKEGDEQLKRALSLIIEMSGGPTVFWNNGLEKN